MQYAPFHQLEDRDDVDALSRLEILLPESVRPTSRDLLAYVLAFVECYQADTIQLEHEWKTLYNALLCSWQRSEYAYVVRLVATMAYSLSRVCTHDEAEHILRMGVKASRSIQDRQHLTAFLSRLGCIYFAHGQYWQGRRLWYEALQLAETFGGFVNFWEPLSSFAYVVDILGSYTASHRFAEAIFSTHHSDDVESVCVALFARGLYARLMNDSEQATNDLTACLQFFSSHLPTSPHTSRKLFLLVVQTELARSQGEYARSQQYAESALSLAHVFSDRYTVAALLMDQGLFTYTQGHMADTQLTASRLREVADQIRTPHVHTCSRFLDHRLASSLPERHEAYSASLQEALSTREIEVLSLVADGLSNCEIAQKLVVTQGTVKKHLEHIYNKLNVRSRTAALAKAKQQGILYL